MHPATTTPSVFAIPPESPSAFASRLSMKRLLPQSSLAEHLNLSFDQGRGHQFGVMQRAFQSTGGLLRGDEVAELLRQRHPSPVPHLARWIVSHQVLNLHWLDDWWVPMFQFERSDMSLRKEAQQVFGELSPAFDGWATVHWFASPNAWLHDRLPSNVLLEDPQAVLQAARADRFVAMG